MQEPQEQAPPSPQHHMVRGSIWAIGLRWAVRFTGLVSTVILARLLTPADFGIVAIAVLVLLFVATGVLLLLNM